LREPGVALAEGRVVAIATESFFGLCADATNPRALDTLLSLKPRGSDRGIGLVVPGAPAWSSLVADVPKAARVLADAFWPGGLSIALPGRREVDARLTALGTIAVRDPGASPVRDLVLSFARPLTATSANLPGEPPVVRSEDVVRTFAEPVEDGRLVVVPGTSPGGLPSTLVSVEEERVVLLRPGAVGTEALRAVLRPLGCDLDGVASSR
jgi:L-threonylcarbamoyladenylate synthase